MKVVNNSDMNCNDYRPQNGYLLKSKIITFCADLAIGIYSKNFII